MNFLTLYVETLRYITDSGESIAVMDNSGIHPSYIVVIVGAIGTIVAAVLGAKYLKERIGELKEDIGKMKETVIYKSTCEKCESNTQEQLKVIKEDIREVKDTGNHTHDAVIEMSTKFELFMQGGGRG